MQHLCSMVMFSLRRRKECSMTQNNSVESQRMSVQIATIVPVELFYEETVAEVRQSLLGADTLSGLHLSESTASQQVIESIKECSMSEFQLWQLGEILSAEEVKGLIAELEVSLRSLDPTGGEKLLALQRRGEGVGTCAAVVLICRFKLKQEFDDEQGFADEQEHLEIGKELRLLRKAINDAQYRFGNGSRSVFSDVFAVLKEKSNVGSDLLDPDYAFSFVSVNRSGDDFQDGLFDILADSTLSQPGEPLSVPCAQEDRGVWELRCDWSTLLQTSEFESTELVTEEFSRLLGMELMLQAYWNRCAKFAKLMDTELRSEVELPDKDEFYLELHRTPDDAQHLISSMASHSSVSVLEELFESSRVGHQSIKFLGMRDSLLARDNQRLSREQAKSQFRVEALAIFALMAAVIGIVFNAVALLRDFDLPGFVAVNFAIGSLLIISFYANKIWKVNEKDKLPFWRRRRIRKF